MDRSSAARDWVARSRARRTFFLVGTQTPTVDALVRENVARLLPESLVQAELRIANLQGFRSGKLGIGLRTRVSGLGAEGHVVGD